MEKNLRQTRAREGEEQHTYQKTWLLDKKVRKQQWRHKN